MTSDSHDAGSGPPPHERRRRYPGTHPRRFDERYKERDPEKYPEMQAHVRAQGRTPAGTHVPVMLEEVLTALRPQSNEAVADLTLGYGSHALAFLETTAPHGRLIGLDLDGRQLKATRHRLEREIDPERLELHHSHFAGLPKLLSTHGLSGVDVIVADLGLSSMQIDDPARGFSYKHDGPLDMRIDHRRPCTAADVLRRISFEDLAAALLELADEPDHEAIARAIVQRKAEREFARTQDLADVILSVKGLTRRDWRAASSAGETGLHPAARTFQALRILVNEELDGLDQMLRVAPYCLNSGGRIGVIAFHSGEDRRVEAAFQTGRRDGLYSSVADEPLRPSPDERHANPRSTSAKLRWAVR